ncbi:MAG: heme exporter protein [Pseudomonadota bacterium]|nr:heme exporter protein [Pseudomonadota bacterium]
MMWESWQAFWAMGGYGLYVWGSFGMTALCVAGEIWLLRRHRRLAFNMLRRIKQWNQQA